MRKLENWLCLAHGGVTRRPGTRFVAAVKFEDRLTRLVAFRVSTIASYMLEIGHEYIRFYKDGGRIEIGGSPAVPSHGPGDPGTPAVPGEPVEVSTPYTEDQIFAIKFDQTADVLSWAHQAVPPSELSRFSHVDWIFRAIAFDVPPSREYGMRPNATLTLSSPAVGTGVTATASAATFEAADVGRHILSGTGQAEITGYTSQTQVTVSITQAFLSVGPIAIGQWHVDGSPLVALTPSVKDPAGVAVTLTTAGGVAAFRDHPGNTDIGKFVLLNGGSVEITGFSSASAVTGILRGELNATTAAPSGAWSLEEHAWSADNGYPACVLSFASRRYWAGTPEQPQTFWGSKAGDRANYGIGVLDDDGIAYTIAGAEVNAIRAMTGAKRLSLFTTGEEHIAYGGGATTDGPITPGNVDVRSDTAVGVHENVAPIRVGTPILFPSATGEKLFEFVFSFDVDGYVANDLLELAQHLTENNPITQLAYQKEPDSRVWATTANGTLLACTYLRAQNVVAWTHHVTQGAFESVAVIPGADKRSEVWVVVRRTINGATRRYVEVFDTTGLNYALLNTDATLSRNFGTAVTRVTGLGHLENETVQIVGDGAVYPAQRVAGGQVTLDPGATRVEVGLGYVSDGETLAPEVPVGGTSQGVPKHWAQMSARVLSTLGLKIGNQSIPFRRAGQPLNQPPALVTDDLPISSQGWDKFGRIRFRQELPLPATILMLTGILDQGQ